MIPGIAEEDVRAMVRLVADVASLNTTHAAAKRHLMNGLMKMVGADCWVWALSYLHPEKPPVYVSLQHEGFCEDRFARYIRAVEHPDMMALTAPFAVEVMKHPRAQLTWLRQQIDSAGEFSRSEAYPFWLAADIAPLMLSGHPLNEECLSLIGIYRRADQPLFTERERKIAHILLTEVPWLHANGWPQDFGVKAPTLPRSHRLVLHLMLESLSRKQIADKLGLSIHTVSDYIKVIYRTFKVHSQAELMRRFAMVETVATESEAGPSAES